MTSWNFRRFTWIFLALLFVPTLALAQEVVNGTVTDSSGAVLPGVVVTVVSTTTGNTYDGVTDGRGIYRVALRVGTYKLTSELSGFGSVTREFQVLVGQTVTLNLQMNAATVTESVTVTGEAPMIQVTSSTLSGNIDPTMTKNLPVNGGNWLDLTLLAPGNRSNGNDPNLPTARNDYDYQLSMDGQQVTNNGSSGAPNPKVSQEAIGEFQFVASRWDASQGRSNGVLVNAVTKSGTNTMTGSFSAFFRSDKFNAEDFVQHRVLPYNNKRFNGSFGGPIVKDKAHFFAYYEREAEPSTVTFSSPYPSFNIDQQRDIADWNGGTRLDMQVTPENHLMLRGTMWRRNDPASVASSATIHPSAQGYGKTLTDTIFLTYSSVLSNRTLNEAKVGFTSADANNGSVVTWTGHPQAALAGVTNGAPRLNFSGYSVGNNNTNWPQTLGQEVASFRDDLSISFDKAGRHDVKVGGEYLNTFFFLYNCRPCDGIYDMSTSKPPANIEQILPVWNDPNTWNLDALNPLIRTYQIGVGEFGGQARRHTIGSWIQDDWRATQKLTLNLGLRYDYQPNSFANFVEVYPILKTGRPNELTDFGPRAGFAYSLKDSTVLRGGFGKYYGQVIDNLTSFTLSAATTYVAQINNDGRSNFASSPFNGPTPNLEQMRALGAAKGLFQSTGSAIATPYMSMPYSWVGTIGFQHQFNAELALTSDFSFNGARNRRVALNNLNLSYDPATGVNYANTDLAHRPIPGWALTQVSVNTGRSNYRGVETAFNKRMSHHYQYSITYTFSGLWDDDPVPYSVDCTKETAESWCTMAPVTFAVAKDLGGEYGLATSDQRNRAVFNGIYQLPYGFLASGLYFYGSGARFATSVGSDLRKIGTSTGSRLRADGTIIPRNDFVGNPIHRVDLRLSKTFAIPGSKTRIEGMFDAFNLFNHENYNAYTTNLSSASYGLPSDGSLARRLQLGFRVSF